MKFSDYLNQYLEALGCTARELAEACGLSGAVISRYRTGEREPAADSEQVKKLAAGISKLAIKKGITDLSESKIRTDFVTALNREISDLKIFNANFDCLITTLNINMKALSKATNFDVSYLYRIRSDQRHPGDLKAFCHSFCQYIVSCHSGLDDKEKAAALLGCTLEQIQSDENYMTHLTNWLFTGTVSKKQNDVGNFLQNLDSFNLDEYIRAIHFDELKVPAIPFQLYSPRSYYGIEEMRKGELDFFRHTVLSKSREPVFMCSDMPMSDMAEDMDFNRKWMSAIALILKKGLHLNIIHNIDRPFHEMMLGLESWIPVYMTGQVSPYHLPDASTHIYHHLNYVSGTVALTGECIRGHHDRGRYYLTNNREEVAYFKQKAADLLSKAQPLMEIYRIESENLFRKYQQEETRETGNRRNLLSSPPISTISSRLLTQIIDRIGLSAEERKKLLIHADKQRILLETSLQNGAVCDEFAIIPEEEFMKHPVHLALSDIFYEIDLSYTYQEYQEHIQLTREYALTHPGYQVEISDRQAFRDIQIHVIKGKLVRISKNRAPAIHFVIRHPKMVNALENFIAPVSE